MKTHINSRLLLFPFTLLALVVLSGCGRDNDPAPDEITPLLTSGVWQSRTVKVDGVDKSSLFAGLTVTFTATDYTTTNGHPVWPASGTWAFTDDTRKTIKRNDETIITINSITQTEVTLSYTWGPVRPGGRSKSTVGNYVFLIAK